MLKLSDFMLTLIQGQLKNTHAVQENDKSKVATEHYPTLVNLTNQGLKDICTKKPIFKGRVGLNFILSQRSYELSAGAIYLDETIDGVFSDHEFIKIFALEDSKGKMISLDTNGDVTTPDNKTLRFTNDMMEHLGPSITVVYQKRHALLTEADTEQEINIPVAMETPLQLFVAGLFLSHMNGENNSVKGDQYYGSYLKHMGEDTQMNTSATSEVFDISTRFEKRGFV